MLQKDVILYGGLLVVSLLLVFWLIPAFCPPHPGYGMPPSLLPTVVVAIIMVISAVNLILTLKNKTFKEKTHEEGKKVFFLNLLKFVIPSFLLMPAMQYIDFIPAGLLFMFVIQFFAGQRNYITMTIVSVSVVVPVYFLLRYVVSVPLP
ncbi:MAG: tripartite tricarboxylate transporter TctB family protein [Thermodesulfovibrionales bacterium]|nr:tripartite tricarboxylate transporter TctB family protein [Thermodesulfovibrionales bacterium]